jgi:hypothetical protein
MKFKRLQRQISDEYELTGTSYLFYFYGDSLVEEQDHLG